MPKHASYYLYNSLGSLLYFRDSFWEENIGLLCLGRVHGRALWEHGRAPFRTKILHSHDSKKRMVRAFLVADRAFFPMMAISHFCCDFALGTFPDFVFDLKLVNSDLNHPPMNSISFKY